MLHIHRNHFRVKNYGKGTQYFLHVADFFYETDAISFICVFMLETDNTVQEFERLVINTGKLNSSVVAALVLKCVKVNRVLFFNFVFKYRLIKVGW